MILNILILNSYQNNFIFISLLVLKKYGNKIGKKYFSQEGGGMFDNGNVNWCMLGRASLCLAGHFCIEPGFFCVEPTILRSNRAFLCGFFVSNECYNISWSQCANRIYIALFLRLIRWMLFSIFLFVKPKENIASSFWFAMPFKIFCMGNSVNNKHM